VEGVYSLINDGAMRKEIEVHFLTLNGEKFSGSVSPEEAKHNVFRECLGFADFSNLGGACVSYKGAQTITFLLNNVINMDELYHSARYTLNISIPLHQLFSPMSGWTTKKIPNRLTYHVQEYLLQPLTRSNCQRWIS
jgi:hypothetical protein